MINNYVTFIGVLGTLFSLISFRSILWEIYTTGITINLPYEYLILTLVGWLLTMIYGILTRSIVVITLGFIYFCIFLSILIVKILNPYKA
uniref:Uncharacterized protein n=1 Tax=viral metagenome TaxID=1070528 RepID=A0A6C0LET2_9ZZZZ